MKTGATLGVIPIRRQHLNDGTYLLKADVMSVLIGYAQQLEESARDGDGHLVGVDAVAAEFKQQIHRLLAKEFRAMADYFKTIE